MSNAVRHMVGVVAGLVATPLIAGGLMYGVHDMSRARADVMIRVSETDETIFLGGAAVLGAAILLGVLCLPRVSPLASLIPGALFTAIGAVWVVAPHWTVTTILDVTGGLSQESIALLNLVTFGTLLGLGVLLLTVSTAPGRWRSSRRAAAGTHPAGPPPAPAGPRHAPAGPPPPAPMGPPPAPSGPPPAGAPGMAGGPPPVPPARPGNPGRPDLGGPPPAPPQTPPSGAVPFGGEPGRSGQGGVGEWTSMYGEDELRGDGR